jgi:hypothetical protein
MPGSGHLRFISVRARHKQLAAQRIAKSSHVAGGVLMKLGPRMQTRSMRTGLVDVLSHGLSAAHTTMQSISYNSKTSLRLN